MRKDPSRILARRYAHAFLNVFYEKLSRQDIVTIESVGNVLNNNPRILFFFKLSVIPDDTKRELVAQWLHEHTVPVAINHLTELLIVHKRLSLLGLVFSDLAALYKQRKGIMEVTVSTSHAVTQEQQKALEQFCALQLPEKKLEYTYVHDPCLLVGVALQSETVRWERSLRKLLQEIRPNCPY